MKPTFRAWLGAQKKRNDPVGDLARDWLSDRGRPRGPLNLDRMVERIYECHGSFMAVDAAERAWKEWKAS